MGEVYSLDKLDIPTGFDAPLAEDALVVVPHKEGIGLVQRIIMLFSLILTLEMVILVKLHLIGMIQGLQVVHFHVMIPTQMMMVMV